MDARKRRAKPPTSPATQHHSSSSTSRTTASAGSKMDAEEPLSWRQQWMFFAVASGACAAFNGVFAKLTTTDLTTSLSNGIAKGLGIAAHEKIVEVVVRAIFFILNLTFNGIMWSLFTTALARGKSATQVSIMNTSTNFLVTAFTGLVIFSEALPPMWWAGASLLVAGSVIAGRKDEGEGAKDPAHEPYEPVAASSSLELDEDVVVGERYRDEDVPDLGELRS
ncbi:transmembrane 42 [Trichoderma arundinaceum]|uniref:Transmembrane 42 n=1 Tax=Trichoderma arundinaceum TaxID=490622 RepID=A0A395NWL3_TRIAR|nr:transmembrane 42 [Trichoderma arundinaceum]